MKKALKIIGLCCIVGIIVVGVYINTPSKTLDFSGTVTAIEHSANEVTFYISTPSIRSSYMVVADNKTKIKLASKQLEKEINDKEINRWQRAKMLIPSQLGENDEDKNIRKIFRKNQKNNYNQIISTLLIYDKEEFEIEDIKKYAEKLYHNQVKNQKILLLCIRSYDYNEIINYIKEEMCEKYEF